MILKRILLMLLAVGLSHIAFCQTVTMKDLLMLMDGRNEHAFLTSKHFEVMSTTPLSNHIFITNYTIHPHSSDSETVTTGYGSTASTGEYLHDIVYTTSNIRYINALIRQLQQLHFSFKKKTDKSYVTTYKYDAPDKYILVNIQKRPGQQHSIMVRHIVH